MTALDSIDARHDVHDSINRLRDAVNHRGPHFEAVVEDRERWTRLCVAMDVATDTETAIHAYTGTPDADVGYLHYYGLMDSWVVQQDAVDIIRQDLLGLPRIDWREEPFDSSPLARNRRLRNNLVSHPMSAYTGDRGTAVNGIIQISMSKRGLTYLDWRNGQHTERGVDFEHCIYSPTNRRYRVLIASSPPSRISQTAFLTAAVCSVPSASMAGV